MFGLIISWFFIILFGFIVQKAWEMLFEEMSETLTVTKGMKILSIILGILWPISLLILPTVVIICLYNDLAK